MNGNKLYRSMSEAKVGGVAAGLGNYFKIDPTIFRLAFVLGTIFTGGTLALGYLAMWLFMPTAASTSSDMGGVVRENLDEMGAKVRGFRGGSAPASKAEIPSTQANGNPGGAPTTPVGEYGSSQASPPQAGAAQRSQMCGILPILLIGFGLFFLMGGLFRTMHWGFPWPLLLIGLCFLAFKGRRYS